MVNVNTLVITFHYDPGGEQRMIRTQISMPYEQDAIYNLSFTVIKYVENHI